MIAMPRITAIARGVVIDWLRVSIHESESQREKPAQARPIPMTKSSFRYRATYRRRRPLEILDQNRRGVVGEHGADTRLSRGRGDRSWVGLDRGHLLRCIDQYSGDLHLKDYESAKND
jgi:hypothetical protein